MDGETTPLVIRSSGDAHTLDDARTPGKQPQWTRRVLSMAAVSAIFGSAAYYSANDKAGVAPTADLKGSSESSPVTSHWSYDNVTLDVTVAASTMFASSAQKMSEVTIVSSGIPQDVIEYANSVVTTFSGSHIDNFALSANVMKYTVGTADAVPEDAPTTGADGDPTLADAPALRRRMRASLGPGGGGALGGAINGLPMSGPGELKTRKQGTMAECTCEEEDDETYTYSYTCTLPHSSDMEFGSGIKAVYQGIFQSYKEVKGQVDQDEGRSTALVLGSYDITAGSNVISLKVHPLSTDQSKSYWWMSAEGDDAQEACTSAATFIQVLSILVSPESDLSMLASVLPPADAAIPQIDSLELNRSPPTDLDGSPMATEALIETTTEDSTVPDDANPPLDSLELDGTAPVDAPDAGAAPSGTPPADAPEAPALLDSSVPTDAPPTDAPPTDAPADALAGAAPGDSPAMTLEDLDSVMPCTTTKAGRQKYILKCSVSNLQATAGVVGGITTALEGLPHAL